MAFWKLSVIVATLWVRVVNTAEWNVAATELIRTTGFGVTAFQMCLFAGLALVVILALRRRGTRDAARNTTPHFFLEPSATPT